MSGSIPGEPIQVGNAKKKRKKKAGQSKGGVGLFPDSVGSLNPQFVRVVLWSGLFVLLVSGVVFGLTRIERRVHELPRYDRALSIEWVDLPDWLALLENRHILESLTRRADLKGDDRLLDRSLAQRLGEALSNPQAAWIRSVDRMVVRPDGVVSVRCRFRRPLAWVLHGEFCYLIGDDGVRLPGRYAAVECTNGALLTLTGISASPPAVGEPWTGSDLSSGVKLAALISDRPFRHQVDEINLANHDGRLDRGRPHIELATNRRDSRIWWGRPPEEEFGTEISAGQKLTLLDTLYRRWGRIDLNRAYVDVRTHPDSVVMPAESGRAIRQ